MILFKHGCDYDNGEAFTNKYGIAIVIWQIMIILAICGSVLVCSTMLHDNCFPYSTQQKQLQHEGEKHHRLADNKRITNKSDYLQMIALVVRPKTPHGIAMASSLVPAFFYSLASYFSGSFFYMSTKSCWMAMVTSGLGFMTCSWVFVMIFYKRMIVHHTSENKSNKLSTFDSTERHPSNNDQLFWERFHHLAIPTVLVSLAVIYKAWTWYQSTFFIFRALLYMCLFGLIFSMGLLRIRSFDQIWTIGEWAVVVAFLTNLILYHAEELLEDWQFENSSMNSGHNDNAVYVVARSGFLGCLLVCPIMHWAFPAPSSSGRCGVSNIVLVAKRVGISIVFVLAFVEMNLAWNGWSPMAKTSFFLKSKLKTESAIVQDIGNQSIDLGDNRGMKPKLLGWQVKGVSFSGNTRHTIGMILPNCLRWLIQFLSKKERSLFVSVHQQTKSMDEIEWFVLAPLRWPRYYWLIYWAAVLSLTLYGLPTIVEYLFTITSQILMRKSKARNDHEITTIPVTLKRKWFHFVAIVVFSPVTLYAPRLQALAYAIALSVLCLVEGLHLRLHIPAVQAYFSTFLDPQKNENDDENGAENSRKTGGSYRKSMVTSSRYRIIVSHMGLIFGCALPLYVALYLIENEATDQSSTCLKMKYNSIFRELGFVGIIGLGVGDAAAAIAGTLYGQWRRKMSRSKRWSRSFQCLEHFEQITQLSRWGRGNRTWVGSMAMLISMKFAVCWLHSFDDSTKASWWPALFWMTAVEAYTSQLDNLVLPIVGIIAFLQSN